MEVIEGKASIQELTRSFTKHTYRINVLEKSRILENTLYFPGWNVLVDGKLTNVEFQDPKNRGLITFFLDKGVHNISVLFNETKLRLASDMVSLLGLLLLMFLGILKKLKLWPLFR